MTAAMLLDREPATVAERDAAVALGEHVLFACDACDIEVGRLCPTGEALLEAAMIAATARHEGRKGWA